MNETESVFDADEAGNRLSSHWLAMADKWSERALACTTPAEAVAWASIASEAYWCATGEMSGASFKDILERGEHRQHSPAKDD